MSVRRVPVSAFGLARTRGVDEVLRDCRSCRVGGDDMTTDVLHKIIAISEQTLERVGKLRSNEEKLVAITTGLSVIIGICGGAIAQAKPEEDKP